jgi:HAE1 family hydrophobic/amphiphilic exporter-1
MVAILVSGFVSISLTPMLCALVLRQKTSEVRHGRLYNTIEAGFDRLRDFYDVSLRLVLRHHLATLLFSLVLLGVTVWLFRAIPKGFLPRRGHRPAHGHHRSRGRGGLFRHGRAPAAPQRPAQPGQGRAAYMSVIGAGGPNNTTNNGRFMITCGRWGKAGPRPTR